ncbi:VOC family protein [Oscillospiraceae bacterium PP1C4]
MSCPVNDSTIIQIGFIVHDLQKTKEKVAKFLDVPVPPTVNSGEYAVTQTVYRGQPAPEAQCYMAFFYFGNLQVEFIQPNEAPSAWREFLETKGEGMHHLAFKAKGMSEYIKNCEDMGMPLLQKGEYRRGNGRYAFLDSVKDLKFFVELLESDEK